MGLSSVSLNSEPVPRGIRDMGLCRALGHLCLRAPVGTQKKKKENISIQVGK